MDLFHAFFLAVIQGVTEFLPISSSAHLILPSQLLGWPDQGLAFDVAVHVGTLLAVVWYFRSDVVSLTSAWFGWWQGERSEQSKLAWWVFFATIPAVISGLFFNEFIEVHLRYAGVIAATTIAFGALLWYADATGSRSYELDEMTWKSMILIGLAQALALIPGTSRSGITMTAALLAGFSRQAAARFSFLLSIPLIAAAGSYKSLEIASEPSIDLSPVLFGVLISYVSAYLCIKLFMKWLDDIGMLPFVIYRFILGALLIFVIS